MADRLDVKERFGAGEVLGAVGAVVAFVLLGLAALALPDTPSVLGAAVDTAKPETGLGNGVNAVLMNFRAFETMMEKAVVLLGLIGVFVLAPHIGWTARSGNFPPLPSPEPELALLLRAFVPLCVLMAVYLFWTGADDPGGAFQGGTVLAAALVLLAISGVWSVPGHGATWLRFMAAGGVGVFGLAGAACLIMGRGFLDFPPALAKPFVIVIEAGLLVSVGALLFLLAGGTPASSPPQETAP